MNENKLTMKTFIQLHILMVVFAINSLFSRLAASRLDRLEGIDFSDPNLWNFLIYLGLSFAFLGIYAIFFQQILKKVKLTVAFANRAIVIVWVLLLNMVLPIPELGEASLSWGKFAGFALILLGIFLITKEDSLPSAQNDKGGAQ